MPRLRFPSTPKKGSRARPCHLPTQGSHRNPWWRRGAMMRGAYAHEEVQGVALDRRNFICDSQESRLPCNSALPCRSSRGVASKSAARADPRTHHHLSAEQQTRWRPSDAKLRILVIPMPRFLHDDAVALATNHRAARRFRQSSRATRASHSPSRWHRHIGRGHSVDGFRQCPDWRTSLPVVPADGMTGGPVWERGLGTGDSEGAQAETETQVRIPVHLGACSDAMWAPIRRLGHWIGAQRRPVVRLMDQDGLVFRPFFSRMEGPVRRNV